MPYDNPFATDVELAKLYDQERRNSADDSVFTGALKSGLYGLGSTGNAAAAALARSVGLDTFAANRERSAAQWNAEAQGAGYKTPALQDVDGLGSAADWAAGMVGSNVPLLGSLIGGSTLGALGGALVRGKGGLAKGIANEERRRALELVGDPGIANVFAEQANREALGRMSVSPLPEAIHQALIGGTQAARVGRSVGAVTPYFLTSAGEDYNALINDPNAEGTPAEMGRAALMTGAGQAALGTMLDPMGLMQRIVKHGKKAREAAALGKKFEGTTPFQDVGLAMLDEGGTEAGEQLMQQYMRNQFNPDVGYDPMELVEAGLGGALVGGVYSTPSALIERMRASRSQIGPVSDVELPPDEEQSGDPAQRALSMFDAIDETGGGNKTDPAFRLYQAAAISKFADTVKDSTDPGVVIGTYRKVRSLIDKYDEIEVPPDLTRERGEWFARRVELLKTRGILEKNPLITADIIKTGATPDFNTQTSYKFSPPITPTTDEIAETRHDADVSGLGDLLSAYTAYAKANALGVQPKQVSDGLGGWVAKNGTEEQKKAWTTHLAGLNGADRTNRVDGILSALATSPNETSGQEQFPANEWDAAFGPSQLADEGFAAEQGAENLPPPSVTPEMQAALDKRDKEAALTSDANQAIQDTLESGKDAQKPTAEEINKAAETTGVATPVLQAIVDNAQAKNQEVAPPAAQPSLYRPPNEAELAVMPHAGEVAQANGFTFILKDPSVERDPSNIDDENVIALNPQGIQVHTTSTFYPRELRSAAKWLNWATDPKDRGDARAAFDKALASLQQPVAPPAAQPSLYRPPNEAELAIAPRASRAANVNGLTFLLEEAGSNSGTPVTVLDAKGRPVNLLSSEIPAPLYKPLQALRAAKTPASQEEARRAVDAALASLQSPVAPPVVINGASKVTGVDSKVLQTIVTAAQNKPAAPNAQPPVTPPEITARVPTPRELNLAGSATRAVDIGELTYLMNPDGVERTNGGNREVIVTDKNGQEVHLLREGDNRGGVTNRSTLADSSAQWDPRVPDVLREPLLSMTHAKNPEERGAAKKAFQEAIDVLQNPPTKTGSAQSASTTPVDMTSWVRELKPYAFVLPKEEAKAEGAKWILATPMNDNGKSFAGRLATKAEENGRLLAGDTFSQVQPGDVVYVSVPGASRKSFSFGQSTYAQGAQKALEAGAVLRTDNEHHATRDHNITGEGQLRNFLKSQGYVETSNNLYSEWHKPSTVPPSTAPTPTPPSVRRMDESVDAYQDRRAATVASNPASLPEVEAQVLEADRVPTTLEDKVIESRIQELGAKSQRTDDDNTLLNLYAGEQRRRVNEGAKGNRVGDDDGPGDDEYGPRYSEYDRLVASADYDVGIDHTPSDIAVPDELAGYTQVGQADYEESWGPDGPPPAQEEDPDAPPVDPTQVEALRESLTQQAEPLLEKARNNAINEQDRAELRRLLTMKEKLPSPATRAVRTDFFAPFEGQYAPSTLGDGYMAVKGEQLAAHPEIKDRVAGSLPTGQRFVNSVLAKRLANDEGALVENLQREFGPALQSMEITAKALAKVVRRDGTQGEIRRFFHDVDNVRRLYFMSSLHGRQNGELATATDVMALHKVLTRSQKQPLGLPGANESTEAFASIRVPITLDPESKYDMYEAGNEYTNLVSPSTRYTFRFPTDFVNGLYKDLPFFVNGKRVPTGTIASLVTKAIEQGASINADTLMRAAVHSYEHRTEKKSRLVVRARWDYLSKSVVYETTNGEPWSVDEVDSRPSPFQKKYGITTAKLYVTDDKAYPQAFSTLVRKMLTSGIDAEGPKVLVGKMDNNLFFATPEKAWELYKEWGTVKVIGQDLNMLERMGVILKKQSGESDKLSLDMFVDNVEKAGKELVQRKYNLKDQGSIDAAYAEHFNDPAFREELAGSVPYFHDDTTHDGLMVRMPGARLCQAVSVQEVINPETGGKELRIDKGMVRSILEDMQYEVDEDGKYRRLATLRSEDPSLNKKLQLKKERDPTSLLKGSFLDVLRMFPPATPRGGLANMQQILFSLVDPVGELQRDRDERFTDKPLTDFFASAAYKALHALGVPSAFLVDKRSFPRQTTKIASNSAQAYTLSSELVRPDAVLPDGTSRGYIKLLPQTFNEINKMWRETHGDVNIKNGDVLLVNRNPALSDGSAMAEYVFDGVMELGERDLSRGLVVHPNNMMWKEAGGDFDGDAGVVIVPDHLLRPRKTRQETTLDFVKKKGFTDEPSPYGDELLNSWREISEGRLTGAARLEAIMDDRLAQEATRRADGFSNMIGQIMGLAQRVNELGMADTRIWVTDPNTQERVHVTYEELLAKIGQASISAKKKATWRVEAKALFNRIKKIVKNNSPMRLHPITGDPYMYDDYGNPIRETAFTSDFRAVFRAPTNARAGEEDKAAMQRKLVAHATRVVQQLIMVRGKLLEDPRYHARWLAAREDITKLMKDAVESRHVSTEALMAVYESNVHGVFGEDQPNIDPQRVREVLKARLEDLKGKKLINNWFAFSEAQVVGTPMSVVKLVSDIMRENPGPYEGEPTALNSILDRPVVSELALRALTINDKYEEAGALDRNSSYPQTLKQGALATGESGVGAQEAIRDAAAYRRVSAKLAEIDSDEDPDGADALRSERRKIRMRMKLGLLTKSVSPAAMMIHGAQGLLPEVLSVEHFQSFVDALKEHTEVPVKMQLLAFKDGVDLDPAAVPEGMYFYNSENETFTNVKSLEEAAMLLKSIEDNTEAKFKTMLEGRISLTRMPLRSRSEESDMVRANISQFIEPRVATVAYISRAEDTGRTFYVSRPGEEALAEMFRRLHRGEDLEGEEVADAVEPSSTAAPAAPAESVSPTKGKGHFRTIVASEKVGTASGEYKWAKRLRPGSAMVHSRLFGVSKDKNTINNELDILGLQPGAQVDFRDGGAGEIVHMRVTSGPPVYSGITLKRIEKDGEDTGLAFTANNRILINGIATGTPARFLAKLKKGREQRALATLGVDSRGNPIVTAEALSAVLRTVEEREAFLLKREHSVIGEGRQGEKEYTKQNMQDALTATQKYALDKELRLFTKKDPIYLQYDLVGRGDNRRKEVKLFVNLIRDPSRDEPGARPSRVKGSKYKRKIPPNTQVWIEDEFDEYFSTLGGARKREDGTFIVRINKFMLEWQRDSFLHYLKTSSQKPAMLNAMKVTAEQFASLFNSTDEIVEFLVQHEFSHIWNNDREAYPRNEDKTLNLLHPDAIAIEVRATLDAFTKEQHRRFNALKKHVNPNEVSEDPRFDAPSRHKPELDNLNDPETREKLQDVLDSFRYSHHVTGTPRLVNAQTMYDFLMDSPLESDKELADDILEHATNRNGGVRGVFYKRKSDGATFLFVARQPDVKDQVGILTHEIGHWVIDSELEKLRTTKSGLYQWVLRDYAKAKRIDEADVDPDTSEFHEWLADNIGLFLLKNKKFTGVAGSWYQDLAKTFTEILEALKKILHDVFTWKGEPAVLHSVSAWLSDLSVSKKQLRTIYGAGAPGESLAERVAARKAAMTQWKETGIANMEAMAGIVELVATQLDNLMGKEDAMMLRRVAFEPIMKQRLFTLLGEDSKVAETAATNPDYAAAYMFVLATNGLITVKGRTGSLMEKLSDLSRVYKRMTIEALPGEVDAVLTSLANRDVILPDRTPILSPDSPAYRLYSERKLRYANGVIGILEKISSFYQYLFGAYIDAPHQRFLETNNPILVWGSAEVQQAPYEIGYMKRGGSQVRSRSVYQVFAQEAGQMLKGLDESELKQLSDLLFKVAGTTRPSEKVYAAEKRIRRLFDEVHNYETRFLKVEYRKDFWPMVLDTVVIRDTLEDTVDLFTSTEAFRKGWDGVKKQYRDWIGKSLDNGRGVSEAEREELNATYRELEAMPPKDFVRMYLTQNGERLLPGNKMLQLTSGNVHTPSFRSSNPRLLNFLVHSENRTQEDVDRHAAVVSKLVNKPGEIIQGYIRDSSKRTEHARLMWRLDPKEGKLSNFLDRARHAGATEKDVQLFVDYVDAVNGLLGIRERDFFDRMIDKLGPDSFLQGLHSRSNKLMNDKIQTAMSWGSMWVNISHLTLAAASSSVDVFGSLVRGEDWARFKKSMGETRQLMRDLAKTPDGLSALQQALVATGVMEHTHTQEDLAATYYFAGMTPWPQMIMNKFFTFNGVQYITDFARALAGFMAIHSIEEWAQQAGEKGEVGLRARKRLAELGLGAGDVVIQNGGLKVISNFDERVNATEEEKERDLRIRTAVHQFVDESCARPDSTNRPLYASNPYYVPVSMWTGFITNFDGSILRPAFARAVEDDTYMPIVLMISTFVPTMFFADMLRDAIKTAFDDDDDKLHRPAWKKNWTFGDHVLYAVERAGFYGRHEKVLDLVNPILQGEVPEGIASLGSVVTSDALKMAKWGTDATPYPLKDLVSSWH